MSLLFRHHPFLSFFYIIDLKGRSITTEAEEKGTKRNPEHRKTEEGRNNNIRFFKQQQTTTTANHVIVIVTNNWYSITKF